MNTKIIPKLINNHKKDLIDKSKLMDDLKNYQYILNQIKQIVDFQDALKNPLESQKRILKKIITRNKDTEYGIKNNFKYIKTIEDYQKYVPIIKYKDIYKEVEKLKNGEQNILTKDKVVYFASTSGTTGKIKLIPITRKRVKNYNKEIALWGVYVLKDYIQMASGKTLFFAGPYFEGKTKGNIPYGSISGYLPYKSPWWLKNRIVPKPKIFNEFNFNKKIEKIAIQALQENITHIGFTAPIEAILFFDYLQNNKDKLIKIISKINQKRAKELKELKRFKPIDIWPNICLVNCFRSKTNDMYINKFLEKLGKKIEVRDIGINASEGRITMGISKDGISGVPLLNTTFFEFIDVNRKKKIPITVDKLKINKKYKVIMTTQEGLYRYDIGDIVKVTGFMKKIPLLKFESRKSFLNIAGELASEETLVKISKKTFKELKMNIDNFTIIPYFNLSKKPRYEFLLDSKNKINIKKAKQFQEKIDENLQKEINDYMQMRNEFGRMDKPVISILKKGSYAKFNAKRVVGSGNPKPINIHNDSKFRNNFEIEKTYL